MFQLHIIGPALLAILLLNGCAGAVSDIVVRLNPTEIAGQVPDVPRVQVVVVDIREEATLERTTIGSISMGRITLDPPEHEIVKSIVTAQADSILATTDVAAPPTIYCGIRTFDIVTPVGITYWVVISYWDVTARIELVLRTSGQDETAAGTATERTYLWPTQKLVERVTNDALRQLAVQTERALGKLLSDR